MITSHHRKQATRVGECSFLYVFDPGAVNADGNFVFGLACNGTRMAADALSVVDYEAKIHSRDFLSYLSGKSKFYAKCRKLSSGAAFLTFDFFVTLYNLNSSSLYATGVPVTDARFVY